MGLSPETLAAIAGRAVNDNMRSTVAGLRRAGVGAGLDRPHRLAIYLSQTAHESGRWRFDREVWGPTAAQARYDTRTDLGNTAARDGDGYRYRGRGPIQITGRDNYARFTAWARAMDPGAPDFVADPDAVLSDPWEGLGPIWFWDRNNLNALADTGDVRGVTRRINGGYNGLGDREALYARAALVLLGYRPDDVTAFQRDAGLDPDGVAGPKTRASMHRALVALPPLWLGTAPAPAAPTTPPPGWLLPVLGGLAAALYLYLSK